MKQENIHNIEVGDTVKFTNNLGATFIKHVTKVSDKSVWSNGIFRESFNTINSYFENYNAILIKKEVTK